MKPCPRHPITTFKVAALALQALCVFSQANAPNNDDFANRTVLPSTATVSWTNEDNTGASMQGGEISPGGISSASVWYEWTAPTTGWFTVHTVPSEGSRNLDTLVGLYTGTNLTALQMLGFNDDSDRVADFEFGIGPSRLVFRATAGTSYKIAVYGYSYDTITQTGPFELHIAPQTTLDFRVLAASFSPTSVNVTSSPATVQATMTVETTSAFVSASVQALTSADNGPSSAVTPADIVRDTNDTYTVDLEIPLGMTPGAAVAAIRGPSGNVWTPEGNDSIQDHSLIPTSLGRLSASNSGGTDTTGPFLSGFAGLPEIVDISGGAVQMNLTMDASDDLSGFKEGIVVLQNELTTYLLASFDTTDLTGGAYEVATNIPADFAAGTYNVFVTLWDKLGNNRTFSPFNEELPAGSTGSLTVTGAAVGYAGWAGTQAFGPGNDDGMLQDPNGDGTVNLLCYAFNLSPFQGRATVMTPGTGTEGLPSVTMVGSGANRQLRIEFLRRKDAGNGLTYRPQFGGNLTDSGPGGWTDATPEPAPDEIDANWERVIVLDPVTGAGPRFGRVVVESTAP